MYCELQAESVARYSDVAHARKLFGDVVAADMIDRLVHHVEVNGH